MHHIRRVGRAKTAAGARDGECVDDRQIATVRSRSHRASTQSQELARTHRHVPPTTAAERQDSTAKANRKRPGTKPPGRMSRGALTALNKDPRSATDLMHPGAGDPAALGTGAALKPKTSAPTERSAPGFSFPDDGVFGESLALIVPSTPRSTLGTAGSVGLVILVPWRSTAPLAVLECHAVQGADRERLPRRSYQSVVSQRLLRELERRAALEQEIVHVDEADQPHVLGSHAVSAALVLASPIADWQVALVAAAAGC